MDFTDIPDFPGYQINKDGIVKSKTRLVNYKSGGAPRLYPGIFVKSKRCYNGDRAYYLRQNKISRFVFARALLENTFGK